MMHIYVAAYEPEHEVAEKLLAMAQEMDLDPSVVKVSRDEGLAFIVPDELGQAFVEARPGLWQPDGVLEEEELVDDDANPDTPPVRRRGRPPKTQE